ncbi:hypothetical protein Drorol1_Dr00011460 [Drosera rotundifolia]
MEFDTQRDDYPAGLLMLPNRIPWTAACANPLNNNPSVCCELAGLTQSQLSLLRLDPKLDCQNAGLPFSSGSRRPHSVSWTRAALRVMESQGGDAVDPFPNRQPRCSSSDCAAALGRSDWERRGATRGFAGDAAARPGFAWECDGVAGKTFWWRWICTGKKQEVQLGF